MTVAKFQLAFTRHRNNLKTVGNLTVKTLCKSLMPKAYMHPKKSISLVPKASQNVPFSPFLMNDAVFKMCQLEFCFQSLQYSKSTRKTVPFLCLSMRHIFDHFQNVPASCERCLSRKNELLTF